MDAGRRRHDGISHPAILFLTLYVIISNIPPCPSQPRPFSARPKASAPSCRAGAGCQPAGHPGLFPYPPDPPQNQPHCRGLRRTCRADPRRHPHAAHSCRPTGTAAGKPQAEANSPRPASGTRPARPPPEPAPSDAPEMEAITKAAPRPSRRLPRPLRRMVRPSPPRTPQNGREQACASARPFCFDIKMKSASRGRGGAPPPCFTPDPASRTAAPLPACGPRAARCRRDTSARQVAPRGATRSRRIPSAH